MPACGAFPKTSCPNRLLLLVKKVTEITETKPANPDRTRPSDSYARSMSSPRSLALLSDSPSRAAAVVPSAPPLISTKTNGVRAEAPSRSASGRSHVLACLPMPPKAVILLTLLTQRTNRPSASPNIPGPVRRWPSPRPSRPLEIHAAVKPRAPEETGGLVRPRFVPAPKIVF